MLEKHKMRFTSITCLIAAFALFAAQGCSKPAPTAQTAAAEPAATAQPEAGGSDQKVPSQACALVTSQEMSAILGSAVVGEPNDHSNGKTECIYKTDKDVGPYVEFSVEWGSGEGAMAAMGMMGQIEPGIANPYEGLGDQAAAIGPALMIRTGEDLVTLTFSGVEDVPTAAKKIFDTAKARL